MKTVQVQLLFLFFAFVFAIPNTYAVYQVKPVTDPTENNLFAPVSTDGMVTGAAASKKELRQQKRLEKKQAKIAKRIAKMQKAGVDFNDPVKKWMWFWIFGWGIGLLLFIIAGAVVVGTVTTGGFGIGALLSLLGSLVTLFGTVSLIVWLVKMFA